MTGGDTYHYTNEDVIMESDETTVKKRELDGLESFESLRKQTWLSFKVMNVLHLSEFGCLVKTN